jgi:hypothetical protein
VHCFLAGPQTTSSTTAQNGHTLREVLQSIICSSNNLLCFPRSSPIRGHQHNLGLRPYRPAMTSHLYSGYYMESRYRHIDQIVIFPRGTVNHETPLLRKILHGFAPETGERSATCAWIWRGCSSPLQAFPYVGHTLGDSCRESSCSSQSFVFTSHSSGFENHRLVEGGLSTVERHERKQVELKIVGDEKLNDNTKKTRTNPGPGTSLFCPQFARSHRDTSMVGDRIPAGRSSGSRIVLLTTPSQGQHCSQWHCVVFVPGYSGGPTPDSYRIPDYSSMGTCRALLIIL